MCVCVCACACVCMCVYARVCATSSYMHSTSGPLRHHAVAYVANHRCLPRTNLNKHLLPHRDRRDTTMAPRRGLAWAVAATVVVSAAAAVVWEGHADMRLALAAAETAAPADYVPPGVREQIALQWQGLNRRHAHCPACATARAVARAAAIQSLTRVGADGVGCAATHCTRRQRMRTLWPHLFCSAFTRRARPPSFRCASSSRGRLGTASLPHWQGVCTD
jgi:hypothetical protein